MSGSSRIASRSSASLRAKGLYSFRDSLDNRHECCGIRKVEPLGRVLVDAGRVGRRPAARAGCVRHQPDVAPNTAARRLPPRAPPRPRVGGRFVHRGRHRVLGSGLAPPRRHSSVGRRLTCPAPSSPRARRACARARNGAPAPRPSARACWARRPARARPPRESRLPRSPPEIPLRARRFSNNATPLGCSLGSGRARRTGDTDSFSCIQLCSALMSGL